MGFVFTNGSSFFVRPLSRDVMHALCRLPSVVSAPARARSLACHDISQSSVVTFNLPPPTTALPEDPDLIEDCN